MNHRKNIKSRSKDKALSLCRLRWRARTPEERGRFIITRKGQKQELKAHHSFLRWAITKRVVFQWPLCITQRLDEAFIAEYKKRRWPMILVLGRLRQEDLSFKVSLGYTVRSCLKDKKGWRWLGSLPDWESKINAASTSLRRPARTIGLGECKRQTPNQSLQSRAPDPM